MDTDFLTLEVLRDRFHLNQLKLMASGINEKDRDAAFNEAVKYINKFDLYATEKIKIFKHLNLDKEQKLDILDIGTGLALFPWLCKKYGHYCMFTDVNPHIIWRQSYNLGKIQSNFHPLEITAYQDFTLPKEFDIITAHRTVFDEHDYRWHVDEWKWFLKNAVRYLKDSGKLFIKTNLTEHAPYRPHPSIRKLFESYIVTEGFNSLAFEIKKTDIKDII